MININPEGLPSSHQKNGPTLEQEVELTLLQYKALKERLENEKMSIELLDIKPDDLVGIETINNTKNKLDREIATIEEKIHELESSQE